MNIVCSICRDVFTGGDNETIYSTSCGHVFHYPCLLQWIERSPNCPHCRSKITKKNMFKLNLYFEGSAGPKTGLEDCQQRNLQFELTMKGIELQQYKETSRIASEQNKGLKLQVKKLEAELNATKSRENNLHQEIRDLKAEMRNERQKNQSFGNTNHEGGFDIIDLDDSDPELLLDIDANLQTMSRNEHDRSEEIITLDDSERVDNNQPNNPELQELKNQMELKEVLLASAVARISELEKENRKWMLNGTVGTSSNVHFP